MFAGSAAFVAIGLSLPGSSAMSWLATGFFGLCAAVAVAVLISPNRLLLTATGMVSIQLFRRRFFAWNKCGPFRVWSPPLPLRASRIVVFDYAGPEPNRLTRLNSRLVGANASLPDTYGLSPAKLAELLEQRRRAAPEEHL